MVRGPLFIYRLWKYDQLFPSLDYFYTHEISFLTAGKPFKSCSWIFHFTAKSQLPWSGLTYGENDVFHLIRSIHIFVVHQCHEDISIPACAQIFPSSVHFGLGKVLKISKVTGTGLAPSFGGYFKVSTKCLINSSEVLYLYSFLLTRTHFYYYQV